jgi:hypothetical protein
MSPDLVFPIGDSGGTADAEGEFDERRSADVPAIGQDAQAGEGLDDAPSLGVDASTDALASGGRGGAVDGAGGSGGSEMGGSSDASGAGGNGGAWADVANLAVDAAGAGGVKGGVDGALDGAIEDAEDNAPATYDSGGHAVDSIENGGDDADGAALAPEVGADDVTDLGTDTYETGGNDEADSPAAGDTGADAPSPDVRGTVACPTTIYASLDPTDPTQIGRHSRYDPASTCGSTKTFPGNGADTTYAHLYDIYHFVNPSSMPVCFYFILTYFGDPLYAAAYSSFDPTNIATGYLGDVGGVLTSPQSMGITVGAGATVDMVVYAIAMGTTAAGSYTLSCYSY